MALDSKQIIFFIFSLVSFFLTVFSDTFLPEQFLRDSRYFEMRINSKITGYEDSFQSVITLYSIMGIQRASLGLKIAEWGIFFVALLISRKISNIRKNSKAILFFSIFYLLLLPFYGSLFTKEILIVLLLTFYLILTIVIKDKHKLLILLGFEILTVLFLRKYYVITIAFTIFYFLIGRFRNRFSILYPIILISIFSTLNNRTGVLTSISGVDVFQIRNITNEGLKIVARSRIEQNPPSGNFISNFLGIMHVVQQILVPYQLLNANAYSLFTFLTVLIVNFILMWSYLTNFRKHPDPESCFLYAFFSTALIFEPDLGSYVRHGFIFALLAITTWNRQSDSLRSSV